jgi:ribosomal protein S18 acetylase RimI-like enzyme
LRRSLDTGRRLAAFLERRDERRDPRDEGSGMIPIRRLGTGDGARAEKAVRAFKGRSLSADSLDAFLANPANYLLVAVAEDGREPVGYLLAYRLQRPDRQAAQMFIYEVDVAEGRRRRGLASALLEEIRRLASAEGMFEAFVLTSRGNEAARSLYARTGAAVEDDAAILCVYPLPDRSRGAA